MFSPDAWSCYTDPLLQRLRSLGVGCHLGGLFMRAFLYSDDQLLIASNRKAMELMLGEVERLALDSNINFSTDPDPSKPKSKLIFVCGRQIGLAKPALLYQSGRPFPFVATPLHLGHKIYESGDMSSDASVKRTILIKKIRESRRLLQICICTTKGTEPGWLEP